MKKLALLFAPLLAITLLTNCNSGPKLYTVTFDTGEGGSEVPSQKVELNKCAVKPTDPTREDPDDRRGYVFNSWRLNSQPFDFATPITNDITLRARWDILDKHTVIFDTNGGSPIPSQKVLDNHLLTRPVDPTFPSTDEYTYTLKEWQLDGKTFDFSTPITKDIALKAIWTAQTREYDIIFNPGAGKWKDGATKPIVKKVKYGYPPTCEEPVKSSDEQYDYVFSGWMPKIEKVTGPKMYTAKFGKLEKNITNLIVNFPNDASNLTITFRYEGTLNNIDWGDGQTSNGESSHKYSNVGKYAINIHGNLTSFSLSDYNGLYSEGNKYVTNIKLKNGITSIVKDAFSYCSSLVSIDIPNSVNLIGSFAFAKCGALTSIRIPFGVKTIEQKTFADCLSLTTASIPSSVTSIEFGAFSYCSRLSSTIIPDGVIKIDEFAFAYCSAFTSIDIPSSVTSIGPRAFHDCHSVTSIVVDSKNSKYYSGGYNAIIEKESKNLIVGCNNTIIPPDISAIGANAFYKCSHLSSANIPDTVTSIGIWAFSCCTSLTSIFIPINVTMVDANVFNGCTGLTAIKCEATAQPDGWDKLWSNTIDETKISWGQHRPTSNVI